MARFTILLAHAWSKSKDIWITTDISGYMTQMEMVHYKRKQDNAVQIYSGKDIIADNSILFERKSFARC